MSQKKVEEILQKSWIEVPRAGHVLDAGNAQYYDTGSWGTFKPVLDKEKCHDDLLCWVACPDSCIIVEDGVMIGFDYQLCKGCGICAEICPDKFSAITMVKKEL